MKKIVFIAMLVGIATMAQPALAAQKPSYAQLQDRVQTLTHSRNVWRQTADRNAVRVRQARAQRDALGVRVTTMTSEASASTGQIARLQSANTTLQSANTTLTAQRDQALSGLSAEVTAFVSSATTASDIYNVILGPARAAWKCGGSVFLVRQSSRSTSTASGSAFNVG